MNNNDRFTRRAKTAIEKAQAAAEALGHSYVGSEHLLLAMTEAAQTHPGQLLRWHGLRPEEVRRSILRH